MEHHVTLWRLRGSGGGVVCIVRPRRDGGFWVALAGYGAGADAPLASRAFEDIEAAMAWAEEQKARLLGSGWQEADLGDF